MKTLRVKVRDELLVQMDEMIEAGWFPSRDYIIEKSLAKFLNSHRPDIMKKYILEDVDWALRGGK